MKYQGGSRKILGHSGHIVDMMSTVLGTVVVEPEAQISYCAYGIDYIERDCEACNLCNYGRDCKNNIIS